MVQILLDKDAEGNGLANMIKDLLSQNIAQHKERERDVKALNGNIAIEANDIDVSLTLVCKDGQILIKNGVVKPYALKITTASDNIMKLNLLKIKLGLPYYFDKAGREVLSMLFKGELKIDGLFSHPIMLTHITRLFSVM
ncbi:MAG: SCP2 sterol-binding domain-containing protein [bacterium]